MKSKKGIIILLIITSIVLYFSLKDNFFGILKEILKIRIETVIIIIGIMFLSVMLRSKGLFVFIKDKKKDYKFRNCFNITVITLFLNGVTPFSTGGQPYQAYLLSKKNVNMFDSVSIMVGDFIAYQFALVLFSLIAILYNLKFNLFSNNIILNNVVIFGFLINLFIMLVCVFFMYSKRIAKIIFIKLVKAASLLKIFKINKEKVIKEIEIFYDGAKNLKNKNGLFVKSLIYNFLGILCLYVIPFVIIGPKYITMVNGIVTSALVVSFGNFMPMPGAAGGIEYCFTEFFGRYITGASLISSMLLWRFFTYYFWIIFGAIIFIITNERIDKKCE